MENILQRNKLLESHCETLTDIVDTLDAATLAKREKFIRVNEMVLAKSLNALMSGTLARNFRAWKNFSKSQGSIRKVVELTQDAFTTVYTRTRYAFSAWKHYIHGIKSEKRRQVLRHHIDRQLLRWQERRKRRVIYEKFHVWYSAILRILRNRRQLELFRLRIEERGFAKCFTIWKLYIGQRRKYRRSLKRLVNGYRKRAFFAALKKWASYLQHLAHEDNVKHLIGELKNSRDRRIEYMYEMNTVYKYPRKLLHRWRHYTSKRVTMRRVLVLVNDFNVRRMKKEVIARISGTATRYRLVRSRLSYILYRKKKTLLRAAFAKMQLNHVTTQQDCIAENWCEHFLVQKEESVMRHVLTKWKEDTKRSVLIRKALDGLLFRVLNRRQRKLFGRLKSNRALRIGRRKRLLSLVIQWRKRMLKHALMKIQFTCIASVKDDDAFRWQEAHQKKIRALINHNFQRKNLQVQRKAFKLLRHRCRVIRIVEDRFERLKCKRMFKRLKSIHLRRKRSRFLLRKVMVSWSNRLLRRMFFKLYRNSDHADHERMIQLICRIRKRHRSMRATFRRWRMAKRIRMREDHCIALVHKHRKRLFFRKYRLCHKQRNIVRKRFLTMLSIRRRMMLNAGMLKIKAAAWEMKHRIHFEIATTKLQERVQALLALNSRLQMVSKRSRNHLCAHRRERTLYRCLDHWRSRAKRAQRYQVVIERMQGKMDRNLKQRCFKKIKEAAYVHKVHKQNIYIMTMRKERRHLAQGFYCLLENRAERKRLKRNFSKWLKSLRMYDLHRGFRQLASGAILGIKRELHERHTRNGQDSLKHRRHTRLLVKFLKTWKSNVNRANRIRTKLSFGKERHDSRIVLNCFLSWVTASRKRKYFKTMVHKHVFRRRYYRLVRAFNRLNNDNEMNKQLRHHIDISCVLYSRRATAGVKSKVLRQWRHNIHLKHKIKKLRTYCKYSRKRDLYRKIFRMWTQKTQQRLAQKGLLKKLIVHRCKHELMRAFYTYKSNIRQLIQEDRNHSDNTAYHVGILQRDVKEKKRRRYLIFRFVSKLKFRTRVKHFLAWKVHMKNRKVLRKATVIVVRRWRHRLSHKSFRLWADYYYRKSQQRKCLKRIVQMWIKRKIARGFSTMKSEVFRSECERVESLHRDSMVKSNYFTKWAVRNMEKNKDSKINNLITRTYSKKLLRTYFAHLKARVAAKNSIKRALRTLLVRHSKGRMSLCFAQFRWILRHASKASINQLHVTRGLHNLGKRKKLRKLKDNFGALKDYTRIAIKSKKAFTKIGLMYRNHLIRRSFVAIRLKGVEVTKSRQIKQMEVLVSQQDAKLVQLQNSFIAEREEWLRKEQVWVRDWSSVSQILNEESAAKHRFL
eukprot:g3144.t1